MGAPIPTLGFATRTEAVIHLRNQGKTTPQIALLLEIPTNSVTALECSALRSNKQAGRPAKTRARTMPRPGFSIKGSGTSWFVTRDGHIVAGPTSTQLLAQTKADHMAREARVRERRCMTCNTAFQSEGSHNRLCNACRQRSDGWMG